MTGRTLARGYQHKQSAIRVGPETAGRTAFANGLPVTANPYGYTDKGKGRAWKRGWHRARMAKQ